MYLRRFFTLPCYAVVMLSLLLSGSGPARAQNRLNDKDMERIMKNLRDDARNFRSPFNSALHKSAIRNTSQEKDARSLISQFAGDTDAMWKRFKDKKKAEDSLPVVIDTAGRIDKLVYSLRFGAATISEWEKIRSELHQIAIAYGVAGSGAV